MDSDNLEVKFDDAMMGIYKRALSEVNYKATVFLRMLLEHKGLETAKRLIHSSKVSDGYTSLWQLGRLDLTVEALIIDNPIWHDLFNEEELAICKKRLKDYRYKRLTS
ncbi:hypothetical protein [Vibrio parahaemolyticus]|uniref:hypothetical protein n=1 Tax=Vibrio parahaemolyticus TaxID=670 RepID=UPI0011228428|nr:hypothetical protein [Vibrio parahaemolyticus]EIN6343154.1 hypothetical protein [Vibrio parahaemolyticus]TOH86599.1 hypothetical protein CGI71_23825 [Vibrio parahaemolyticus]TOK99581.1 hypothetical protein CGI09_24510 [Vibrio parahaemolyticus]TOP79103.1 hypothetical protein CGH08_24405 [Vibrio parahaemolyticus]TOQ20135.1 hypothetical protein CGG99_24275 [Vibrio parahaemolyticus]